MIVKWVCSKCNNNNIMTKSPTLTCPVCGKKRTTEKLVVIKDGEIGITHIENIKKDIRIADDEKLEGKLNKNVENNSQPNDSLDKKISLSEELEASRSKRRTSVFWLCALALVIAAIIISSINIKRSEYNVLPNFTTLDVTDENFQNELKRLDQNNIIYDIDYEYSDSSKVGQIIKQNVQPGTKISSIHSIKLIYSGGLNYRGIDEKEAVNSIKNTDWDYETESKYNSKYKKGTVCNQILDFKTKKIKLEISKGLKPIQTTNNKKFRILTSKSEVFLKNKKSESVNISVESDVKSLTNTDVLGFVEVDEKLSDIKAEFANDSSTLLRITKLDNKSSEKGYIRLVFHYNENNYTDRTESNKDKFPIACYKDIYVDCTK